MYVPKTRTSVLAFVTLLAATATLLAEPPATDQSRTAYIAGRVIDLNGSPVGGALVHVATLRTEDVILRTRTNQAGSFRAEVPEGRYMVSAGLEVFPSAKKVVSTFAGQVTTLQLVLDERPIPSTGTVFTKFLDVDGNPIAQAWGHIYSSETGDAVARFVSDRDGYFKVDLKPGTYYIEAHAEALETTWWSFSIQAGDETSISIVMPKPSVQELAVVAAYVVTFDGQPIQDLTGFIFANDSGQPVARFVTDSIGSVRQELPPGKYQLRTIKREFPSAGAEFEVTPGNVIQFRVVPM